MKTLKAFFTEKFLEFISACEKVEEKDKKITDLTIP